MKAKWLAVTLGVTACASHPFAGKPMHLCSDRIGTGLPLCSLYDERLRAPIKQAQALIASELGRGQAEFERRVAPGSSVVSQYAECLARPDSYDAFVLLVDERAFVKVLPSLRCLDSPELVAVIEVYCFALDLSTYQLGKPMVCPEI